MPTAPAFRLRDAETGREYDYAGLASFQSDVRGLARNTGIALLRGANGSLWAVTDEDYESARFTPVVAGTDAPPTSDPARLAAIEAAVRHARGEDPTDPLPGMRPAAKLQAEIGARRALAHFLARGDRR